jgi:hypothetical protein
MPRSWSIAIATAAMTIAGLVGHTTASFADAEPNDVISQAEGPVKSGQTIEGRIANREDHDFYVFYASSQSQLHFELTSEKDGYDTCARGWMENASGEDLPADYTTPPGTNRFFVHVVHDDCAGTYSATISPAAAIVDGPALDRELTPTTEPNETAEQAWGPLAAGRNYTGGTETENDQDWFLFHAAPGTHQLDIAVSTAALTACDTYDSDSVVELHDARGERLQSAEGSPFSFGHIRQTITGPATYYVTASVECRGRWMFRVEPSGALTDSLQAPPPPTTTPAPTPSSGSSSNGRLCRTARASRKRWGSRLSTDRAKLRRARSRSTRTRLKRRIAAERRTIKRIDDRIAIYC